MRCLILITSVILLTPAFAAQGDNLDVIPLNGMPCGLEGTAKSPKNKDIDRHKNRYRFPGDDEIDPEVSLAAMLAPGRDVGRFNQEKAAVIRGFVINVIPGGKETCNCGASDPDQKDTHIELSLAPGAPETQRVIVEVTPRLRMIMQKKGVEWKTKTLEDTIKNKWVEVTGWLLFDSIHIGQAENTNPGGQSNWRATCWEIHPITKITVLDNPPAELADFRPAALAGLHRLHAAHLSRSPHGKTTIAAMHARELAGFDQSELAEAEEEVKERRAAGAGSK